jgi:hypothetical protein
VPSNKVVAVQWIYETKKINVNVNVNDRGIHLQTCRKSRLTYEELLKAVFCLWYNPKLYREDNSGPWLKVSCSMHKPER